MIHSCSKVCGFVSVTYRGKISNSCYKTTRVTAVTCRCGECVGKANHLRMDRLLK